MEETTIRLPEWHILEKSYDKWRVYSRGLRPYGTFKSIKEAYDFIINHFPHKRGEILVHNMNGIVCEVLRFPLRIINK